MVGEASVGVVWMAVLVIVIPFCECGFNEHEVWSDAMTRTWQFREVFVTCHSSGRSIQYFKYY